MNDSSHQLGFVAVFLATVLTTGCHRAAPPKAKTVEVFVTTAIADEVTDYQDFTGRLDALKTVDVRPRVSGYVHKALLGEEGGIKEGAVVREGELLFVVDPRTYQADLNLAEANLRQAEAERKLQMKNAERARHLIANKNIGQEEFDQILANRDKAIATVGSMTAARDRAKLYLEFTQVKAPLSGRVSRCQVDVGNLVIADTTILTTIVTENPMYAYFDVDERTYLELATATSSESSLSAASPWGSQRGFPVLMRLANEKEFAQIGRVDFRDNRVNANTGTYRMRGVFDNPRGHLKPGLFARIRLPLSSPQMAWLIPDEAILSDQGRKYVFIVTDKDEKGNDVTDEEGKPAERVEYRAVTLGKSIEGMRVLKFTSNEAALKKDEAKKNVLTEEELVGGKSKKPVRVIVKGMQRVREGTVVHATMEAPPKPPRAPLTELLKGKGPVAR